MKEIYGKYKERLIKISGRNRSLYMKNIKKKYSYDIGKIVEFISNIDDFLDFLWHKKSSFVLLNDKIASKLVKAKQKTVEGDGEPAKTLKAQTEEFLTNEIAALKYLKREVEDLEKETGRYELYIGFPFILGALNADLEIKAPLFLSPVTIEIDKDEVILRSIPGQSISLNKSFALAYSKEKNIKIDNLIQDYEPKNEESYENHFEVIDYLIKSGFKIKYQKKKGFNCFDQIDEFKPDGFESRNAVVLGRFTLANSIYNDYLVLEKDDLTSPALEMLIEGKAPVKNQEKKSFFKRKTVENYATYEINDLDYSQESAIEQLNKKDNIVIYGPPGTGKSQTIVNIISDALCKNKKVLVVSQKRAALDVVFSRLGKLNNKAMHIPDPEKDKGYFYDRIKEMHSLTQAGDYSLNQENYEKVEYNIIKEIDTLNEIADTLFTKTPFGLNLQEMFAASYNIGKDSKDYQLYNRLKETNIIEKNYEELSYDLRLVKDKNLTRLYHNYQKAIKENPIILQILDDVDVHKLKEAMSLINKVLSKKIQPFDVTKYPYSRYFITFYLENAAGDRKSIKRIADIITKVQHPKLAKSVPLSVLFLPAFPFVKTRYNRVREDIKIDLNIAKKGLSEFENEYKLLKAVLTPDGYALTIGGLLNGNTEYLLKLYEALENYTEVRDMNVAIKELSASVAALLEFSYDYIAEKNLTDFELIIDKILPIRIYHEIIKNQKSFNNTLSKIATFDELRHRILSLKSKKRDLSFKLACDKFSKEYRYFFDNDLKNKDYLYNITKQRALWSIRRLFEVFEDYLLRLFPCWLLSPEVVSTILPLRPNMFDIVVFDEASQMYIESAIPSIYRGEKIVIAGDNKQLRPTSGFVKRYLGDDSFDYDMDLSMQAALEVESLLDLATAKYKPVNLTYHYRSHFAELIDFSNIAFYDNKLQIAPNVSKNAFNPPIERIKTNKGVWQNRHNHEEAAAVVKLVKSIFRDRLEDESVGIVTFNIEQKEYIEDLLDAECDKSPVFRRQLYRERNRIIDGENASLFVKNLENVQGDERDIIIFSIGYAKNESDKVVAQFGSLSMEGGENRLNVAITRAKKKIYVITSIEPEELDKAETTKNNGPKLLKKYLQYSRAVSSMNSKEIKMVLDSINTKTKIENNIGAYEEQIKTELEKLGYEVYTNLGNTDYKISLGVYDSTLERFVLGIECDYEAYKNSPFALERDVYRFKFLESRGWNIVRVWSRDWWLSRKNVLDNLVDIIENNKETLLKKQTEVIN